MSPFDTPNTLAGSTPSDEPKHENLIPPANDAAAQQAKDAAESESGRLDSLGEPLGASDPAPEGSGDSLVERFPSGTREELESAPVTEADAEIFPTDSKPEPASAPEEDLEVPARKLNAGTVVMIAGSPVTLLSDAIIAFDQGEGTFAGMLQISGNLEVNRENLKFRYDTQGNLAGLNEQVDDPDDLPAFIASLDLAEANWFGLNEQTLNEYKRNTEAAAAEAAAEADRNVEAVRTPPEA